MEFLSAGSVSFNFRSFFFTFFLFTCAYVRWLYKKMKITKQYKREMRKNLALQKFLVFILFLAG